MKKPYLIIVGYVCKEMLLGISVVNILLLSLAIVGCDNDTGAAAQNISPRDAAIAKAEAW